MALNPARRLSSGNLYHYVELWTGVSTAIQAHHMAHDIYQKSLSKHVPKLQGLLWSDQLAKHWTYRRIEADPHDIRELRKEFMSLPMIPGFGRSYSLSRMSH